MLHAATQFLSYYLRADTKYRVHSPSLFSFVTDVLETDLPFYCYDSIENQRKSLLQNRQSIEVEDLGAGSGYTSSNIRRIDKIAATAVSSSGKCRMLHRIATHYQPTSILELGTSLGISTSYLAHVATTVTIEGSQAIADVAAIIFKNQNLSIDQKVGDIADVLKTLESEHQKFDLIYADGNHRKEATLEYFESLIPLLNKNGVILFDDIYWSKGMTEAWNIIKADPRVKRTIDLYTFGIVEIGESDSSIHTTLIKSIRKPFQFGFFSSKAN